jgi:hypothetical protein
MAQPRTDGHGHGRVHCGVALDLRSAVGLPVDALLGVFFIGK